MARHPASKSASTIVAALVLLAAPAAARNIKVKPGSDAHERIQTALIEAKAGDTVVLAAGRYALADGLSLDVAGVTVKGAGPDKTILDFTGQKGEGEGLLVTSNDVVIRDLAVENAKGNGIKSKGSDGISFVNLRVEWTGGPKATNGAYGVYPVSSKNVLIEQVTVKGASDAGIYVGQSRNIIVRRSRAEMNVAGIEIENSYDADVIDNVATNNAGGILVFDLPDLPQQGGHGVRIRGNRVTANNHANFAAPGNIVAGVPSGTGIMVMANRDVHVRGNDITGNNGNAVMIVSYTQAFTDTAYNPLPRGVAVGGNVYAGNGTRPAFAGGAQIARAVGGTLPPVMWDGITRYAVPGSGAVREADGRIIVADTGWLSLGLVTQGTPASAAQPAMMPPGTGLPLEPPAIVLPAAQEARAR
ncbi:parallel beta-helix domain-containing protein [Sandarakinorhabdus sp.]|uniref:parallel beta-helix domain-containing protein n=1 Tax=Sandarakinorhabdus sp. TaxID=1916663 RepID=UPI00286E8688|nr:parallel beta-helix domain-containing protein [Sandarakinorhabdus sp.]